MTDSSSDRDDLFAQWRKQVEAGTNAWIKTVQQMASQGHVPPPPDPAQFWRQFSSFGPMHAPPFPGAGPVDPQVLAQWKQFLDDWIAAWSRALEQAMGTEAFAEALGKTLDQFLTIQGKARQAAERSGKAAIDALGLPSREQVVGLSRQVMDLEDRIEALEDKLDGLRDSPHVTGLEGRLEALEDKVESLRKSPPAPPAAGDGSPPRRPAGRTTGGGAATAGGGAAKTSRAAKTGAAAKTGGTATAGRGAKTAGRGAKTRASATKTGSSAAKTGGAAGRTRKRRA